MLGCVLQFTELFSSARILRNFPAFQYGNSKKPLKMFVQETWIQRIGLHAKHRQNQIVLSVLCIRQGWLDIGEIDNFCAEPCPDMDPLKLVEAGVFGIELIVFS